MMNWYLKVLKQYADFNGRARRKEYWVFVLFNMFFGVVGMLLDTILEIEFEGLGFGPLYIVYATIVLIPGLAVTVRRLHDIGKSGWMILIGLIPVIGTILFLVFMITDSDSGENQYGQNQKIISNDSYIELSADTVLLLVIIWMFTTRLFFTLISKLSTSSYQEEWFKLINTGVALIWAIVPIGLAFLVKNKSKQVLLFIIGGIYFIYGLYEIVFDLM